MSRPYHADRFDRDGLALYFDDRNDELLDGVVTAAALVAKADGWIEPAERARLLAVLKKHGLMSVFTSEEVLEAFDSRLRQLDSDSGPASAANSFQKLAGRSVSRLVMEAGEEVALADGRLHAREMLVLSLIHRAMRTPPGPAAWGSA